MARIAAILILCVLTYGAMLGGFDPWDIALGLLVAAGTLIVFRQHLLRGTGASGPALLRRLIFVVPMTAYIVYDIVRGTVQVAVYSLRLRPLNHPGIVAVPLDGRSRLGAAMSGFFVTIAPGSFLVDYDREDNVMLVHCVDASDPDGIRADRRRFYDRFQRHVFP